jgi:hypothetical protein
VQFKPQVLSKGAKMATVKIDLSLEDTKGSIKSRKSEVESLNRELEKTKRLSTGTKSGSGAVKSSYSSAMGGSENAEYGRARGSMGATGAGARDFANQAQGLGGLVRLYATWAANIFAVSAAFSALSNAANVTNMIQGMNQLGISSGIALGSMAQRFVEASDGAISLKDAVSATVKAVSSGLSQAQFEQLGKVANNASKALGIDMADAVSRLTRGITKLEPELLDELGIFTKVGAATEDYAKRIGKSAASLTDFEKRQAFANAVLAEGTAKFGSIKIEANPYDQLAASLTNLSNKVLGFINTALGPLISLLSSSPTALGIVVAGLGSLLLKQAIPAIGQYKSALASSADESEKKWQQKSDAIKKIEKDQFQYIINMSEAEADAKLASFEKAERRLKKSKGMAGVFDERTQNILQGTTLSKEDRGYLQSKQAEAAAAGNKQLAAAYKEARVALDGWIKSEKEHEKLLEKISDQTNKNISGASKLSAAGFARDELNKARISKSRSALISEAAENASTGSMSQSWEKLNKGIKDEKLTGISAGFTRVGGAAAIATTAISRAASVVTGFFGTVGLVVGALSTLYSFMSKNRKEAEALGSAIEQSDEAVKTATGTFEKFNNVLSSESIMAKANATVGLVDAMDKLVNKFADFDKASNGVDMVWESLKSLVGLSKQDDVAKGLASSITKLLETIEDPALKSEFEGKLKNLLSIDDLNFFAIDDALDSIDPKKLKQLTKDAEELKVKNQAVASSVALIRDGFKNVTTAFTALENTLKPNDVVSNYASAIAKQSDIMTKAFENPKVAAATFNDIIADTSKLQAFSPESAAQILAVAEDFKRLTKAIQDAELQLKSLSGASYWEDIDTQAYDSLQRDAIFVKLQADKKSLAELGNVLKKATADSMEYAFKIALAKVKTASAQAGIDQQKGLVSALPKSQATIEAQMTLENKSIDIRKQEIQSIYTLTNQLKISTASQKVMDLEKKLQNATPEKQAEISKELGLAQAEEQIYRGTLAKENVPAELKGAYFEQQQLRSGMQSQLAVLDINKISNEQKRALDKKLALFEQDNRNDADYIKEKEVQRDAQLAQEGLTLEDRDTINKQFRLVTEAERKRQATIAERQTVSQAKGVIDIVTKPAVNGISGAAAQAGQEALTAARTDLPTYEKQTKDAEARFAILEATTDTQAKSALLVETTARDYDRISQILSDNNAASTLEYDTRVQSLDIDQKSLDTKLAQKTISQQQYEDQTNLNELKRVELNTAQQLNQALSDYINKTVALNKEIAAGNVTPQRSAQIETDKANALKFYTDSTQRIREQGTADKERLNILGELSVRQKAYADIFENSMKGMEDAIVEFTKTGKLSFESMISSFIEGLLRYEIQQAQMSFIRGSGGFGGILNAGFNYFATMGDTNAAGNAMFDAGLNMMAPSAKGNAFDYGIEAFAKGGAFTNSIVNSPTLFKFAKGTGLMGEAGPEAIMPLTRDGSGNLGVRAQGGGSNVEVVINNYSTEKAETKETVDSKGNRKIEVMVGDMVADQLSKPGSSTQQALTNGFGQRPSIVRR